MPIATAAFACTDFYALYVPGYLLIIVFVDCSILTSCSSLSPLKFKLESTFN